MDVFPSGDDLCQTYSLSMTKTSLIQITLSILFPVDPTNHVSTP